MVILIPDMADEDTQAAQERVHGYITGFQGQITETLTDSPWGRRRLAYTIRHESVDYRDGFYSVIHFSAQPSAVSNIERELKLDTNVIRYLLVTDDPKAGDKNAAQPEGEVAATAAEVGEAPAAEETAAPEAVVDEAPAAGVDEDAAAGETAAPVAETEVAEESVLEETTVEDAPAAEQGTDTVVEETAATIEGEEEPAPADGAEAVTADSKES